MRQISWLNQTWIGSTLGIFQEAFFKRLFKLYFPFLVSEHLSSSFSIQKINKNEFTFIQIKSPRSVNLFPITKWSNWVEFFYRIFKLCLEANSKHRYLIFVHWITIRALDFYLCIGSLLVAIRVCREVVGRSFFYRRYSKLCLEVYSINRALDYLLLEFGVLVNH